MPLEGCCLNNDCKSVSLAPQVHPFVSQYYMLQLEYTNTLTSLIGFGRHRIHLPPISLILISSTSLKKYDLKVSRTYYHLVLPLTINLIEGLLELHGICVLLS
jgi:hypothetical protein